MPKKMTATTEVDPTDDGTLRPNEKPISNSGTGFQPMRLEDHDIEITLPDGVSADDPYSLFQLYYSEEIIQTIVDATNNYERAISSDNPKARGKDWYPATTHEIYLYLAICIYIILYIENKISNY